MDSDISIVIPFYNEKDGINELIEKINSFYKERKFNFDIILVDDGSTDETAEIIKNTKTITCPVKLISLSKNFGSHAAIRAGIMYSTGKYVTCLPADLQVSFDTVEKLYSTALEGYDVISGVRAVNKVGIVEKAFSRLYAFMMRKYVVKDFPYKGLETVMISNKVRKIFNENVEANSSFALQILSMGFKGKFIDVKKNNRKYGKTKWTIRKKVKLLIDSFVAFSYAPIRLVTVIGIAFFITGFFWSAYLITRKLIYNDLASGWPALMSILLLGFGITNISLGIIAEYLWRTLEASRKRPVYIIDEIIELTDHGK